MTEDDSYKAQFGTLRRTMVEEVAVHAGVVCDKTGRAAFAEHVMAALNKVPRHDFVPLEMKLYAYVDSPIPIGYGKTISQPFIVALMTDLLEVEPAHRVLEIGTGLGYQAAVLAELANQVYTVEIIEELGAEARLRLEKSGYTNIRFRIGNGHLGWPGAAPFDRIIATAAPDLVPPALLTQLAPGGRMVVPAGLQDDQKLLLVTKNAAGRISMEEILPVRFSSMTSGA